MKNERKLDLLDVFLIVLLSPFFAYLIERLTPQVGWLLASAIILGGIVFTFWFISGKPVTRLLKFYLPFAAICWSAGCLSFYWFNAKPISAALSFMPVLFTNLFSQLPPPVNEKKLQTGEPTSNVS